MCKEFDRNAALVLVNGEKLLQYHERAICMPSNIEANVPGILKRVL
jgi:hypothetical protein